MGIFLTANDPQNRLLSTSQRISRDIWRSFPVRANLTRRVVSGRRRCARCLLVRAVQEKEKQQQQRREGVLNHIRINNINLQIVTESIVSCECVARFKRGPRPNSYCYRGEAEYNSLLEASGNDNDN